MDAHIRRLERQARLGDYEDRARWKAALERAGRPDPDIEELLAPLSHEEALQEDFDGIWWHSTRRFRFGWDMDPVGGLIKAHNMGYHSNRGENSKRKTIRTHRDSSHLHKIKRERSMMEPLSAEAETAARRRKKRFGGRMHKQYRHRGEFGPWLFEPNLDE
jgi:hypothetical protein